MSKLHGLEASASIASKTATMALCDLISGMNDRCDRTKINVLLSQGASFIRGNELSLQAAMAANKISDKWLSTSLEKWHVANQSALAGALRHRHEELWSLLHTAAQLNYPQTLRVLLNLYPIITPDQEPWMQADRKGLLPLSAAALAGHVQCVQFLMRFLVERAEITGNWLQLSNQQDSALEYALEGIAKAPENGVNAQHSLAMLQILATPPAHASATEFVGVIPANRAWRFLASNAQSAAENVLQLRFGPLQRTLMHWLAQQESKAPWAATCMQTLQQRALTRPLLNAPDAAGDTPLHLACSRNCYQIATVLKNLGADQLSINHSLQRPLQLALANPEMLKLFFADSQLMAALVKSLLDQLPTENPASSSLWAQLMDLLKSGLSPNLNIESASLLTNVVRKGDMRLVAELLHAGKQLQPEPIKLDNKTDRVSESALQVACEMAHLDICDLLLSEGAQVDRFGAADRTALHLSIANHDDAMAKRIVQLLVKYGASLATLDGTGMLPLHLASSEGKAETVKVLLDAAPGLINRTTDQQLSKQKPVTSLQLAARSGHRDCVDLLISQPYAAEFDGSALQDPLVKSDECLQLMAIELDARAEQQRIMMSSAVSSSGKASSTAAAAFPIAQLLLPPPVNPEFRISNPKLVVKGAQLSDPTNFSKLYHCTWGGLQFVLKIVHGGSKVSNELHREMEIHRLVSVAEGVLRLVGWWDDPESHDLCLVLPLMKGGSLRERLSSFSSDEVLKQAAFVPRDQLTMLLSIARSMYYLTSITFGTCSKRFLHRDLNTSNILLDEYSRPHIADFGIAKVFDKTMRHTINPAGTSMSIAPEMCTSPSYDSSVDIYAFAIVMWEVLSCCTWEPGTTVYVMAQYMMESSEWKRLEQVHKAAVETASQAGQPVPDPIAAWQPCDFRPSPLPTYPDVAPSQSAAITAAVDLMRSCWQSRAKHRPSWGEITATLEALLQRPGPDLWSINDRWDFVFQIGYYLVECETEAVKRGAIPARPRINKAATAPGLPALPWSLGYPLDDLLNAERAQGHKKPIDRTQLANLFSSVYQLSKHVQNSNTRVLLATLHVPYVKFLDRTRLQIMLELQVGAQLQALWEATRVAIPEILPILHIRQM